MRSDIGELPAAASAPCWMQGFSVQMFGEPRQEDHEPEPKLNRKTVNSVTTKVTNELESSKNTVSKEKGQQGKVFITQS